MKRERVKPYWDIDQDFNDNDLDGFDITGEALLIGLFLIVAGLFVVAMR